MMSSEHVAYSIAVVLLVSASLMVLCDDVAKLKCRVQKLQSCPEHLNLPYNFKDLHIEMDPETETLYVSGVLDATEPLEQGLKGMVTIFDCLTDAELSCEKYLEIEIKDFCAHLPEQNKSWSPIVSNLQNFDPHCPVPPGVYELRDAALEVSQVENMYALEGHWRMQVVVEFEGRMFACLRGDAILSLEKK